MRDADVAAVVDAENLDHDDIAELVAIVDASAAVIVEVGEVERGFGAGEELEAHEWRRDAGDGGGHDLADGGLAEGEHELALGRLYGFGVRCGDADPALVVDVDVGAGGAGEVADASAAGTNDVADALFACFDAEHFDGVLGDRGAALGEDAEHAVQDVEAGFLGGVEGLGEGLFAEPLDFEIHLQGRDALARAADLEVHVTQVIFIAEDIREDGPLLALDDESHGDAGDGCAEGDAGIHQGEAAGADRGHGGRAV